MSRLLVATPRLPYPVIGGDRLRIHEICRALAREHELTLLSLCDDPEQLRLPIPDDGIYRRVERILLPRWRSALNCLIAVPGDTPLQVAYYRSRHFRRRLEALAPEHDGVLYHLVRMAQYAEVSDRPSILEATDAISLNYKRLRELGATRGLRRHVFAFEQPRLERYERAVIERFDVCSFVSPVDRDFLAETRRDGSTELIVAGNGVDAARFPFTARRAPAEGAVELVFVGNLDSLQNTDAATWFAEQVLPTLGGAERRFRLKVIGKIPEGTAARLAAIDGVSVTGRVEDVAAAAAGGAFGICPVRIGAGIQNKNLEYMALGLPCVTSSLGAEGLGATSGEHLRIADTPEQWRTTLETLLSRPEEAERMAAAARRFVESDFRWRTRLEPLCRAVADAVAGSDVERGADAVAGSGVEHGADAGDGTDTLAADRDVLATRDGGGADASGRAAGIREDGA